MSTFAQYLGVILLHEAEQLDDESYSGSFLSLSTRLTQLLGGVEVTPGEVRRSLEILNKFSAAKFYENPLTNGYWQIDYDNFRYYFAQENPDFNESDKEGWKKLKDELEEELPILVTYADNGRPFALDVIEHLRTIPESEWSHLRAESERLQVPASDRIVTISHNQQVQLSEGTDDVIDLLEKENSINGDELLRSRILGQLKAARELVNAQTFRLYLLYGTVVSALGILIEKYSGKAIGIAASKLLEMLIEEVFKP